MNCLLTLSEKFQDNCETPRSLITQYKPC